jgi:hydrogenase expression/formation protein HypC
MCLAMPGRVESVRDEAGVRMGRIDFGGVVRDVCLACVPDIAVGEWALVHVGFALGRIDETAARETLRALAAIGGLAEPTHDDPAHEPADGAEP